uniref:Transcription factor CBF/NF-Y/archaeal histone domain-containing protein n=1 Tax=Solanum lycopersicum TaxID=4081 RepID=A0A3Q7G7C1_SOLLC
MQLNLLGTQCRRCFGNPNRVKSRTLTDFKNRLLLPPTRIKKIIKKDKDLRMVAAESPILMVKAYVVHGDDATDPFTPSYVSFYAIVGNNGHDDNLIIKSLVIQNLARGN